MSRLQRRIFTCITAGLRCGRKGTSGLQVEEEFVWVEIGSEAMVQNF
jgi:hypothetical protein